MMPDAPAAARENSGAPCHVFVYGTLRAGEANDITRLKPAPRLVGRASVAGRLVDLGAYPGLVPDPGGTVVGEVYAIDAGLLPVLDAIEGLELADMAEYERGVVGVMVAGVMVDCFVYWLRPHLALGRPAVACGDWVRHRAFRDEKS